MGSFLTCLFLSPLGVHRFQWDSSKMGVAYLFTFGFVGIGWIVDIIAILSGHPFGTVKWHHGAHYLLCKGIAKTSGELGLSFLVYNLKRAINMVGTKKLIVAMNA